MRMSPVRVLPQLFRSRLTCDGGGAITAGTGSDSFGAKAASRPGAETGGATTFTVCCRGARELAKSCGVSCGAGATTLVASAFAARSLSRFTSGAGVIGDGFIVGVLRVFACEISGAGGTMFVVRLWARLPACTSGVGGTALISGRSGANSFEPSPSAGGGPGFGLKASRFATALSLRGSLSFGASTTVSARRSPRTTRIVCVR